MDTHCLIKKLHTIKKKKGKKPKKNLPCIYIYNKQVKDNSSDTQTIYFLFVFFFSLAITSHSLASHSPAEQDQVSWSERLLACLLCLIRVTSPFLPREHKARLRRSLRCYSDMYNNKETSAWLFIPTTSLLLYFVLICDRTTRERKKIREKALMVNWPKFLSYI